MESSRFSRMFVSSYGLKDDVFGGILFNANVVISELEALNKECSTIQSPVAIKVIVRTR